jgi:RNA polymerase sigma-70 factor (ECF subfamily)
MDDLGRLYDRVGPSLYRYALMILADPIAAEDAVHDVFTSLTTRRLGAVRTPDTYLRRAVRNACYDIQRRQRTRGTETSDSILLEAVETAHVAPERRLDIERALRSLPPEQREVVHLKIFEGMTLQEIAGLVEVPLNTVASRYRYAVEKLRKVLDVGDE